MAAVYVRQAVVESGPEAGDRAERGQQRRQMSCPMRPGAKVGPTTTVAAGQSGRSRSASSSARWRSSPSSCSTCNTAATSPCRALASARSARARTLGSWSPLARSSSATVRQVARTGHATQVTEPRRGAKRVCLRGAGGRPSRDRRARYSTMGRMACQLWVAARHTSRTTCACHSARVRGRIRSHPPPDSCAVGGLIDDNWLGDVPMVAGAFWRMFGSP